MQPLALNTPTQTDGQARAEPRLVRAAHEFEGQMMKELLKPLTESDSLTGEDEDSASGSGGALGEFAAEALGRALSDHGGFGIADRIVGQLSHESNKKGPEPVTAKVHGNTVMRIHQ